MPHSLRSRFLLLSLACVVCWSCDDPVAPSLAAQVYSVVSVDGHALPTDLPVQGRGSCPFRVLHRSEFAFGADATFEQRFWFSLDPAEQPAVYRSSFVQRGWSIYLADGAGSGDLRRGSLRLQVPPTQICASLTWEAVLK